MQPDRDGASRSSSGPRMAALLERLSCSLDAQSDARWHGARLAALPDKGLAHDHIRLGRTGVLARIPKQSQLQLGAADNLAYQAACFVRASASGHAPRLFDVLAPSADLPRGALLVEAIDGHAARLPRDLPAIATALARIHALALPPVEQRAPIKDDADPIGALAAEVQVQAAYLDAAGLEADALALVRRELQRLAVLCEAPGRPAKHLISFDAHPGNFVIRTDGSAVLVDLEKCRYSAPSLDLAHATLYTSTTWERHGALALSRDQVHAAYDAWHAAFGPAGESLRRWHLPLRRAMWLWSVTWCAKWRVLAAREAVTQKSEPIATQSAETANNETDGEDWSETLSAPALIAHVRERVTHYLDPWVIKKITEDFDAF